MLTIQRGGDWFMHPGMTPAAWDVPTLLRIYSATALRGLNWIVNVPPDTTGQIPQEYVTTARALGQAAAALRGETVARLLAPATLQCPGVVSVRVDTNTTAGTAGGVCVDAVYLAEDMVGQGQRVANYSLCVTRPGTVPATFALPPARVPGPAYGQTVPAGSTIGWGVLDVLDQRYCGVTQVTVSLTGCLTESVTLAAVELRRWKEPAAVRRQLRSRRHT